MAVVYDSRGMRPADKRKVAVLSSPDKNVSSAANSSRLTIRYADYATYTPVYARSCTIVRTRVRVDCVTKRAAYVLRVLYVLLTERSSMKEHGRDACSLIVIII